MELTSRDKGATSYDSNPDETMAAPRVAVPSFLDGKKVIFVFTELVMGGAERQALLLAEELRQRWGATIEFWGLNGAPGRLAEVCESRGIVWRIFPLKWWTGRALRVKSLISLAYALRKARPHILLPYLITPNVACGMFWRWTGAQVCIWNQRDNGIARLGPKAERWAVSRVPWFISNSQHGAEFLKDELGAPADRVRVVNNGIVLDAPKLDRKAWRERLGIDEECFAACMVANLTQYKDHATLLEAWRIVVDQLASQRRSAVLLLAGRLHGDGSTHHSAKALAYDLELGNRVRFLGAVDDIAGVLRASDLGVFSSRSESSPNGVLESMAAGLAIAATDEAGIRDAVGPGGQPFLSPIGDAKSMADQILRFANDRELRLTIGLANRRRVEEHFSPQRMTQDTIAIFAEALHIEPPNLGHDSSVRKHHSLAIE